MKRSEAIVTYRDKIIDCMVSNYRAVLGCGGKIQYRIYVWEDGELEELEDVHGSTSYLQAKKYEPRKLYYVCTITAPCFTPWDFADHPAPEDEEEREREEREIIDWLIDEYRATSAPEVLDAVILEAKQEEEGDW